MNSGEEDVTEAISTLKARFQDCVKQALKEQKKDRVVFFVDDLDRLEPARAVELLEVLKLFRKLGGQYVTVGSDAHTVDVMADGFDVAFGMLKEAGEAGRINFVGNVEAREAVEGAVDVIVSDGYSGNIFLKTMEGTGLFLAREIKKLFMKNLLTKLAAVLVSGGLKEFKKLMSADEVGGTARVGISKPVIKAHGSSDAYAIKNAVRQAKQYVSSGIIESIAENIDVMRLDAPSHAAEEN